MQPCYRTRALQNSRPWVLALARSPTQGMKIPSTFEIETSGPRRQNEMIQTEPQCLDRNHLATAAGLALGKPRPQSSGGWAGPRVLSKHLQPSECQCWVAYKEMSHEQQLNSEGFFKDTQKSKGTICYGTSFLYTMNMYYSRWLIRS